MSVLARKRSESPLRVYETASIIRRDVSLFMLQRFCNEALYENKVVTENGTEVETKEKYPQFAVDFVRNTIMNLFQELLKNIVMANAVYPTNEQDLVHRERLQNNAIELCFAIQTELNHASDMFPQQLKCLLPYADRIGQLTAQLRKWKKANKKIRERIISNTSKRCKPVSSTYFCNVNNNGNANNNNASNGNGVSPDFEGL